MTPHSLLDMVSNVAEKVAQRLPPTLSSSTTSSRNLDVTWITDRILATSKPAEAPIPTRKDTGRNGISTFSPNDNTTSATPIHEEEQHQPLHYSTKPRAGVNPGALSSFLTRRHDHHFLLIKLQSPKHPVYHMSLTFVIQCMPIYLWIPTIFYASIVPMAEHEPPLSLPATSNLPMSSLPPYKDFNSLLPKSVLI